VKSFLKEWLISLENLSSNLQQMWVNMSHLSSGSIESELVQARLADMLRHMTSVTKEGSVIDILS